MSPLVILVIGIVTVLGMIIVLRLNAFLALITAALIVSLLAPGDIGGKVARVAKAFGETAGNIGIVIALAAIIGKCMMDSGAADRIVRAFLRLLGQKQAPTALMGSGFVLAVPVFFDTVFYLLVPLARSLFRKTQSNYLLYVLAIAAGGAITHTLVPPTPGPLVMAANLGVDVGLMIIVGGLVAIPSALAGLVFSRIIDRVMPLPMRPLGAEPELESLPDSQQPPLLVALLPVALPVLLIGANTVLQTMANSERAAELTVAQVRDWEGLVADLAAAPASEAPRLQPARRVMELLEEDRRAQIAAAAAAGAVDDPLKQALIDDLNTEVLDRKDFYRPAEDDFPGVVLNPAKIKGLLAADEVPLIQARGRLSDSLDPAAAPERDIVWDEKQRLQGLADLNGLLAEDPSRMSPVAMQRMNRLLLESAYPQYLEPHVWNTPFRQAANYGALFGDANFALLLSAAVSLLMYVRQRRPSRHEVANTVEVSLMSGGVIILITSAGGAFGAMLKAADIGPAIEGLFGGGAQGLMLLFLGFGVSALLKVAQGSSTVAMITASSMIAAMLTASGSLPFNAVYLCTAIGSGSLIGSWMNDSGFWIFAKMSGLTEEEALKSWTPLLLVLGVVGLATTLVLANVMPLPSV